MLRFDRRNNFPLAWMYSSQSTPLGFLVIDYGDIAFVRHFRSTHDIYA